MHHKELPKVIVVCGPTAAGKTDWSLRLAHKINGEIISADSRQIYKKMDIGTAKPAGEWQWLASWQGLRRSYVVDGITHHLIDFLDPGKRFTVAEFRDKTMKYIKLAYQHKKIPIIAGGTGLYIDAVVNNLKMPRVEPNYKLRKSLEEKGKEELFELLKNLDPEGAKHIDRHNPRRLIRALEVCIMTGEPFSEQRGKGEKIFDFLKIGVSCPREVLYERIDARVDKMIDLGLEDEIKNLLKQKYSWELPSMSGIGYRQLKAYFEGTATKEQAVHALKRDTKRYARRQLTWFKRDKDIVWCESYEEAEQKLVQFLGL